MILHKLLFIVFFFSFTAAWAQKVPSNVKFINPPSVATPKGYSHASVVDLGNCRLVLMSGQVALDSTGNLVGKGNVSKQTEQVFQNIKKLVEAAGGSINNLVKLSYYILDVSHIQAIRGIRDRYVNTQAPPASTLVEVSKLFRDDILIEIEATAIIPTAK